MGLQRPQLSPRRPGNGRGLPTSHCPGPSATPEESRRWANAGPPPPTKASKPRPADASSSREGRREIITEA